MRNVFYRLIDFFWIAIVGLAIVSSFNSSVAVGDSLEKNFRYLFPQGWGFFTKSPLEPQVELYRVDNTNTLTMVDYNNSSLKNAFGFSRMARIKGYELAIMVEKVAKGKYIEGKRKDISKALELEAVTINPCDEIRFTEKGIYILKVYKPIPWAWATNNQEDNVPCSFVKIKIL